MAGARAFVSQGSHRTGMLHSRAHHRLSPDEGERRAIEAPEQSAELLRGDRGVIGAGERLSSAGACALTTGCLRRHGDSDGGDSAVAPCRCPPSER